MTSAFPSTHAVNEFIEADLNYLVPNGRRPVNYAYPAPPGVPQNSGEFAAKRVRIVDGRRQAQRPTLDVSGFELVQHASQVADFSNESTIRSVYYSEVDALLRRLTGAVKVVIFDHTLRYGLQGHTEEGVREPARRVHNDQTFVSGPRRVRDHLPPEEAEQRLRGRFAIINVWRPIGHPVESSPLAMCDARSIDVQDLVSSDLVYRDKVGETYAFAYNPRHRWSYFPRIRPDEAVLLKIYDSLDDGRARLTAHTAFEDPRTAPDARPRRSIEVRSLVFF
jgi:hypothetical protein